MRRKTTDIKPEENTPSLMKRIADKIIDHISAPENPNKERAPETPAEVRAFGTQQQIEAAGKPDALDKMLAKEKQYNP